VRFHKKADKISCLLALLSCFVVFSCAVTAFFLTPTEADTAILVKPKYWSISTYLYSGPGANYILGGQDFCFYYMFETNLSGHNIIWVGIKLTGGLRSPNDPVACFYSHRDRKLILGELRNWVIFRYTALEKVFIQTTHHGNNSSFDSCETVFCKLAFGFQMLQNKNKM